MTSLQTLRLPKGLLDDLETTVIQQDRQFLTEVARSLGLPVAEVLRKCLGTGANQSIHILLQGSDDPGLCPWWTRYNGLLWRPCSRLRLSPTSACQLHTHTRQDSLHRIQSDTVLTALPTAQAVLHEGLLYWVTDDLVIREDNTIEPDLRFKFVTKEGQRICVINGLKPNPTITQ